jgi:hypothetical protein
LAGKTDPSKAAKDALQKELEDAAAAEAEADVEPEKVIDGVMRFVCLFCLNGHFSRIIVQHKKLLLIF